MIGCNTRFWSDWINPFKAGSFNWINFTFFAAGFEWGQYKGKYLELTFNIVGLGVEIEFYDKMSRAVFSADMDQQIAGIKEALSQQDEEDDIR